MPIGIIGLPKSGKTTVFNAVTRGHAETAAYRGGGAQPNIGVAKVPDVRLQVLTTMFKSKKTVPAEVQYIDMPSAPEGLGKSKGISGEFQSMLQRCDAYLIVARSFQNPAVPHIEDTIDPYRDVDTMLTELAFADLALLEKRVERIQSSMKSAKVSDRDALNKEMELVNTIKASLEKDIPVREQEIPAEAQPIMNNYQLLTSKPVVIVFNIGEEDLPNAETIEAEMRKKFVRPGVEVAALCGSLEMELAQMSAEEEADFRSQLKAGESGLERMIRLSYKVLGLVSFLTTGEDETRAWTVPVGSTAVAASSKIHSDIARGFIRAEVVAYEDLKRTGSMVEAKKQAVLRSEGKTYIVKDGDVINFLFNV